MRSILNTTRLKSLACVLPLLALSAQAAVVTFDDAILGATGYSFDADSDSVADVTFSSLSGPIFLTGPGPNQLYVQEPGLVAMNTVGPELRVDFLNGAVGSIYFGYVLSSSTNGVDGVSVSIYSSTDTLLASGSNLAYFTATPGGTSSFPEAEFTLSYSGQAAYALLDFGTTAATAYIIDNFSGTFGSTENTTAVPEPSSSALLAGVLMLGAACSRRRARRAA